MKIKWKSSAVDVMLCVLFVLAAAAFAAVWRYAEVRDNARIAEAQAKCDAKGGQLIEADKGFRCIRRGSSL